MAAPATTARVTPVGTKLDDGFSTLIAFATDPDISFWEIEVQPIGIDGGDPIEVTTMHNSTWRSMAARSLLTATPITVVVAYDPVVYDQIIALCNVEGAITINFSNSDTVDFYGFLQTFEPDNSVEGERPTATLTIVPTNIDPSDGSEAAPNYKTSVGTD